jgi:hypothetical protein
LNSYKILYYNTLLIIFILDHCLYIYFICTDHIGKWPANKSNCVNYFVTCMNSLKQNTDNTDKPKKGIENRMKTNEFFYI